MSASNYFHLDDCTVVKATDKALLVEYGGERYWMPRSQLANAADLAEGDEFVTVSATRWICEQKGIPEPESDLT